jgi:hypothetical protein
MNQLETGNDTGEIEVPVREESLDNGDGDS